MNALQNKTIEPKLHAEVLRHAYHYISKSVGDMEQIMPPQLLKQYKNFVGDRSYVACPDFTCIHAALRELDRLIKTIDPNNHF